MFDSTLLRAAGRFSLFCGIGFDGALFVEQSKHDFFVVVRDALFVGAPMRLAQLPNADRRKTGIAVGNGEVAHGNLIEKVQFADIPRIAMKAELASMTVKFRMLGVD